MNSTAFILTISAHAENGKDTFAKYLKEELETTYGKKVLICHYGDYVKFIATQYYGWDGNKDEKGRALLQWLGTDVFRKNRPDCWVNVIRELILGLGNSVDYVLIPDTRFPNEITGVQTLNPQKFLSVRIERPNFENHLTPEQRLHPSETALDDWQFDVTVQNDSTEEKFKETAKQFAKILVGKENG